MTSARRADSAAPRRRTSPAAARPDRHRLYEQAVQCPEADVQFFHRVYRERNHRRPLLLREDFCGTAAIAAEWVRQDPQARALGVDLHAPTLRWGLEHNLAPLGPAAARVRLIEGDVRQVRRPAADVIAALNFSYFVFPTRAQLRSYFRSVRRSLTPGGLFVLDIFGGWEAQALTTETRRRGGFTYIWEQVSFDPLSHRVRFHIHFRLRGGRELRRAFTYDWRFWTIPEVRELLHEAGFGSAEVYWEGTERGTGKGNGVFRRIRKASSCPGWIAYIVAA